MARRDATGVRLYTRNSNDFADRLSLIVAAVAGPCLSDGELADFNLLCSWRHDDAAVSAS